MRNYSIIGFTLIGVGIVMSTAMTILDAMTVQTANECIQLHVVYKPCFLVNTDTYLVFGVGLSLIATGIAVTVLGLKKSKARYA